MRGGSLVRRSDRRVQPGFKWSSQHLCALISAAVERLGRRSPPERLAEADIERSVGGVGDSDDNALAETIHGLYKAEVIHWCGPWRSCEAVEFDTLEWVDGFNGRRLLEPTGHVPPTEAEARYDEQMRTLALAV